MARVKTSFSCSNCTYQTAKWIGSCPSCSEWNSFIESKPAPTGPATKNISTSSLKAATLFELPQIDTENLPRLTSGIGEWDRVLGGGILPGSFLILTGDPGIGKSTLLLHVATRIAQSKKVIYFSSEESLSQLRNRAERLANPKSSMRFSDQASIETILTTARQEKPDLLIIDSIQNCYLSGSQTIPGTIGQLREVAFLLMRLAKEEGIATLTTGHITKDGHMAGPKILEHMVDAVFYLQGEDRWHTRVLRSVKNRFGNINETGFFEMQHDGLHEVANINQHLISDSSSAAGAALVTCIEGSRPILLELQALCIASKFGMPQRVVSGIDQKRVVLVAAILEKYLKIRFSSQDIFFNVSNNFKVKESSCDLGIALALLSSYFQKPLPERSIAIAEISLTGQIKPINLIDVRVSEATKFGIKTIFTSKNQKLKGGGHVASFTNVYELLSLFPETG